MMVTIYDLHELQKLCERQRAALDMLLNAVGSYIEVRLTDDEIDSAYYEDMKDIYITVKSLSTMTGSYEQ